MNRSLRVSFAGLIALGVPVLADVGGCSSSPKSSSLPTATVGAPESIPTVLPTQTNTGSGGTAAVTNPPAPVTGTGANPMIGAAGATMMLPGTGGVSGTAMAGVGGAPMMMTGSSLYNPATGELSAPAPADGVQIQTSVFDLAPGDEKFTCYHAEIPLDGEIDVSYYESTMAVGSHHFILYKSDTDTTPVGTMDGNGCLSDFQNWIYSSAQPHIDLRMPDGVAMVLGAHQRVMFDMHYINTSDKALHAHVTLNVIRAKGEFQKAASLISFNSGIFLQPNASQTVTGDCTPGAGAKFFYMLTHTHRRGQLATIDRLLSSGQVGEQLVKSTDWEHPDEEKWLTAPYLTFKDGEKFRYSCQYMNDIDQVVTAGPSAATNEMCMAITYYFPASAGGSCN